MKLAVALIAALLVPAVVTAAAAQTPVAPASAPVSLAVTTAVVRDGFETRTDVLLLWNRNVRTTPIGHAVKACIKAGGSDILGGGIMSCSLTLHLPKGKVAATGIVHNLARYTMIVTGGTGLYEGAHGPLFVRRVGDGVRRMTFIVG